MVFVSKQRSFAKKWNFSSEPDYLGHMWVLVVDSLSPSFKGSSVRESFCAHAGETTHSEKNNQWAGYTFVKIFNTCGNV